jgi:hypothetical protein
MQQLSKVSCFFFVLISLTSSASSQCHVFWTDAATDSIYRQSPNTGQAILVQSGITDPGDIDLDPRHNGMLYYISGSQIKRISTDGVSQKTIIDDAGDPESIALDLVADQLYWVDSESKSIFRSSLTGESQESFQANLNGPSGVQVQAGLNRLIWADQETAYGNISFASAVILSAPLTGGSATKHVEILGTPEGNYQETFDPTGTAILSNESVLWGIIRTYGQRYSARQQSVSVHRANLTDSSTSQLFTPGARGIQVNNQYGIVMSRVREMEVANGYIYYIDNIAYDTIHRTALDGSSQGFITPTDRYDPMGIALLDTQESNLCNTLNNESNDTSHYATSVWRPSAGQWYFKYPIRGYNRGEAVNSGQWGLSSDEPIVGTFPNSYSQASQAAQDYAVWRPSEGRWYICWQAGYPKPFADNRVGDPACGVAGNSTPQWGLPGDYPLSGDFDGDSLHDLTVWRPHEGNWYMRFDDDSFEVVQWGLPGDLPVPEDYDGDGITDIAVWRPWNGSWYILLSTNNFSKSPDDIIVRQWGLAQDHPIPGDFDGDNKADLVVWRPQWGMWYLNTSSTDYQFSQGTATQWGLPGDHPIAKDFDNDGRRDFVVWRPANGTWYFRSSADDSWDYQQWGLPGDVPIGDGIRNRAMRMYGRLR